VLLEAAACGVPIVGSQVDSSRDALLDRKPGQLVDPGDQVNLVQAIEFREIQGGRSRLVLHIN
jgi:glycosyltransferase involved in cell wall biosynthesis